MLAVILVKKRERAINFVFVAPTIRKSGLLILFLTLALCAEAGVMGKTHHLTPHTNKYNRNQSHEKTTTTSNNNRITGLERTVDASTGDRISSRDSGVVQTFYTDSIKRHGGSAVAQW